MRPWVLRALVMTVLYGVGQTLFVALASRFVDLTLLWSIVLLGTLLLVGLVWGGAEVIADRVPPEWTWLKASFAAGPAAGLLTWVLLALFVDAVGVEDLSSALIGRASFTVLLILGSSALGSRLGWLSLRRSDDPRADRDPSADTDEPVDDEAASATSAGEPGEAPVLPSSTAERVAARRARRREEQAAAAQAPSSRAPTSGAASSGAPSRAERGADGGEDTRVPFGSGPFADPPSSPAPASAEGYASPVVAVLPPVAPLPSEEETPSSSGDDDEGGARRSSRRRFGLRRPDDDG